MRSTTELLIFLIMLMALPVAAFAKNSAETSVERAQFQRWLVAYLSRRADARDRDAVYGYAFADLNGDGRPEAVVWERDVSDCGSGGCNLYVFAREKSGWRRASTTLITRPPIKLLSTSSNGWRDLAAREAGGGIVRSFEARLRFNGHKYEIQWPADWTGRKAPPRIGGRLLIDAARLALFPDKCHRTEEVGSVFGSLSVRSGKPGSC